LVAYVVIFHFIIIAAYWAIRRAAKRFPLTSDIAAFVASAMLTICYFPSFLGAWAIAGVQIEALYPDWFCRLAVAYVNQMKQESWADGAGLATQLLWSNVIVWGVPAVVYVLGLLNATTPYKLKRLN
jgi:hypothetical protein